MQSVGKHTERILVISVSSGAHCKALTFMQTRVLSHPQASSSTFCFSFVAFIFLPDSPVTWKGFTERQRYVVSTPARPRVYRARLLMHHLS